MAKPAKGLAEQLRQAIRDGGRSLNRLAAETRVDSGRLSRFMRGERDLTVEAAGRVCAVLGLELVQRGRPPRGSSLPATTPRRRHQLPAAGG